MKRFSIPGAIIFICAIACATSPVFEPKLSTSGTPTVSSGEKIAVFTILAQEVAVSNSQGLDWIARRTEDDYWKIEESIYEIARESFQLEPIPRDAVLDQGLVLEGHFPLRERWHLNPSSLPIIKDAEHHEKMSRTARSLDVKYFMTVYFEHSISKVMLMVASVSCSMRMDLYNQYGDLIYRAEVEDQEEALPYDREKSLPELFRTYGPITNAALQRCDARLMEQVRTRASEELRFRNASE